MLYLEDKVMSVIRQYLLSVHFHKNNIKYYTMDFIYRKKIFDITTLYYSYVMLYLLNVSLYLIFFVLII